MNHPAFVLFLLCLSFGLKSAHAKEIHFFAVNFSNPSLENVFIEELSGSLNSNNAVVSVLDVGNNTFSGYFLPGHSQLGNEGTLRGVISDARSRFRSGSISINLPLTISTMNEFITSHYREGDDISIYLIDVLEHEGRNFSFKTGFPNDGFLSLDDNDFSLVAKLPSYVES